MTAMEGNRRKLADLSSTLNDFSKQRRYNTHDSQEKRFRFSAIIKLYFVLEHYFTIKDLQTCYAIYCTASHLIISLS